MSWLNDHKWLVQPVVLSACAMLCGVVNLWFASDPSADDLGRGALSGAIGWLLARFRSSS